MARKTVEDLENDIDTAQNASKTTEILQEKLSTINGISQTSVSSYAYVLSYSLISSKKK